MPRLHVWFLVVGMTLRIAPPLPLVNPSVARGIASPERRFLARWLLAGALTLLVGGWPHESASATEPANAVEVRPASQLPSLAHYQLDGAALWRLADFVVTVEGGTPRLPQPVYVQFGSVSCAPCHELAGWLQTRLPGGVLRIYAHVDEAELADQAVPLGRMRRQLAEQMAANPSYAGFMTVTSVPYDVVVGLTGAAALPAGLFILPDGRHVVFGRFDRALVERALAWYVAELATL